VRDVLLGNATLHISVQVERYGVSLRLSCETTLHVFGHFRAGWGLPSHHLTRLKRFFVQGAKLLLRECASQCSGVALSTLVRDYPTRFRPFSCRVGPSKPPPYTSKTIFRAGCKIATKGMCLPVLWSGPFDSRARLPYTFSAIFVQGGAFQATTLHV
jgi:hypothetical protein